MIRATPLVPVYLLVFNSSLVLMTDILWSHDQSHTTANPTGSSSMQPTVSEYEHATTLYGFSPRASTMPLVWGLLATTRRVRPSGISLPISMSRTLSLRPVFVPLPADGMLRPHAGCGGTYVVGVPILQGFCL